VSATPRANRRSTWIAALVVVIVVAAYFVGWPIVAKRVLAAQCAKDGGRLNESGTVCLLR
jgi:hypothetical protein